MLFTSPLMKYMNYIYFSETSKITLNEVFFEPTGLTLKEAPH